MDDPAPSTLGGTKYEMPDTMFADEELHSQFQGFSTLNAKLDGLIGGPDRSSTDDFLEFSQSKFRKLYNHTADVNNNLLTRGNEILCAVVVSTDLEPIQVPADKTHFASIVRPHIVIAANPRLDDYKDGHIRIHDAENKTSVAGVTPPPLANTQQGVIRAVCREYKQFGREVLFPNHVGFFMGFLQDCYAAGLDAVAYKTATQKFSQYVYMVSHPKMKRRLDMGSKDGGNFLTLLTNTVADYPRDAFKAGIIQPDLAKIKPNAAQQAFIRQFIGSEEGGDSAEGKARADHRCNTPLYNEEGREFFHDMMAELVGSVSTALKDISDMSTKLNKAKWEHMNDDVVAMERLVERVQWAMQFLYNFVVLFGRQDFGPPLPVPVDLFKATKSGSSPKAKGRSLLELHLFWLAQVAGVRNRTDSPFPPAQPDPSQADLAVPQGTQSQLSVSTPAAQAVPAASLPEAGQPTAQHNSSPVEDPTWKLRSAPVEDPESGDDDGRPSFPSPGSLDPGANDNPDDELQDQIDLLCAAMNKLNSDGSGWVAAVMKFLELVCLHQHGLTQACPEQQESTADIKSQHIRHAKFTVVDVKLSAWVNSESTTKELLDLVISGSEKARKYLNRDQIEERLAKTAVDATRASHRKQDAQAAKDLQEKRDKNTTEREIPSPKTDDPKKQQRRAKDIMDKQKSVIEGHKFLAGGTMHCETIIMACMILLTAKDIKEKLNDVEWLERHGIIGLRTILLKLLRNPAPMLTVSKRCCSACWTIFVKMVEDGLVMKPVGTSVDIPGHHANDTSVRLPPFLLKEYVQASVDSVKEAVTNKLLKLQAIMNRDSRAESDPGSAGAGSNPPEGETPSRTLHTPSQNIKRPARKGLSTTSRGGASAASAPAVQGSSSSAPATPSRQGGQTNQLINSSDSIQEAEPHIPGESAKLVRKAGDAEEGEATKKAKGEDADMEDAE